MKKLLIKLVLCGFLFVNSVYSASLDGGEHARDHRILHGNNKLSEHHAHEDDEGEHDPDYDHEAFLGEDAAEFDQLSPEESQARLAAIVDKIDKDADGYVTQDELREWIHFTQQRYVSDDVERQWTQHNPDGKDEIKWEEYRQLVYGFLDDEEANKDPEEDDDSFSYKRMETRDERRWKMADEDGNGYLTRLEFKNFLHPEDADHMRDIVVQETLEDIDKDQDGKISLAEYIGDMYRGESDESEPEWVKTEREQFHEFRDTDKDGYMNHEEVRAWIVPADFDHSDAESKHLIYESDSDNDSKLTKQEILDKYDLFVGSQATDFGEALTRHDEF